MTPTGPVNSRLCVRLQVVSTKVGGVPEVLPLDLIHLAQPTATGEQCLAL